MKTSKRRPTKLQKTQKVETDVYVEKFAKKI